MEDGLRPRRVLRLALERSGRVLAEYESHLQLQRAVGAGSKITTTGDGYRIAHPLAPNNPMLARWVDPCPT